MVMIFLSEWRNGARKSGYTNAFVRMYIHWADIFSSALSAPLNQLPTHRLTWLFIIILIFFFIFFMNIFVFFLAMLWFTFWHRFFFLGASLSLPTRLCLFWHFDDDIYFPIGHVIWHTMHIRPNTTRHNCIFHARNRRFHRIHRNSIRIYSAAKAATCYVNVWFRWLFNGWKQSSELYNSNWDSEKNAFRSQRYSPEYNRTTIGGEEKEKWCLATRPSISRALSLSILFGQPYSYIICRIKCRAPICIWLSLLPQCLPHEEKKKTKRQSRLWSHESVRPSRDTATTNTYLNINICPLFVYRNVKWFWWTHNGCRKMLSTSEMKRKFRHQRNKKLLRRDNTIGNSHFFC